MPKGPMQKPSKMSILKLLKALLDEPPTDEAIKLAEEVIRIYKL